jgi:hypothetical protein
MELETILQDLYDSEINIEISWIWDGGFNIKLGDEMNGFKDDDNVQRGEYIVDTIIKLAWKYYPNSKFVKKYRNPPWTPFQASITR